MVFNWMPGHCRVWTDLPWAILHMQETMYILSTLHRDVVKGLMALFWLDIVSRAQMIYEEETSEYDFYNSRLIDLTNVAPPTSN